MDINFDGFGKTKSQNGENTIEISVNIRKDRQIPDFDMIENLICKTTGFDDLKQFNEKTIQIAQENGGIFVSDAFKLKDKDIISLVDPSISPKDYFAIPALKALKKSLIDYLKRSNQEMRLKKYTSNLVCFCRHVTDLDIKEQIDSGKDSFEQVQIYTSAGTGCGSCISKTKELIEQYRKTAIGEIK